jgi:hypothetical protein
MRLCFRAFVVSFAFAFTLAARTAAQPPTPAVQPGDVATIDGIITALYESISGPAGAARQWDRFRSLMAPGARLVPTGVRPDSTTVRRVWSAEEYITLNDSALKARGFFEKEIARKTDRYGNIVQMFSTYESRRNADDPQPFARGINSIQLHFDGKRWWVVTIFWEGESRLHPIPAEYLPRRQP